MRSEVRHEDGRLLVTAIGSYSIFPRAHGRDEPDARGARLLQPMRAAGAGDRRLGLRRRRRHPGRPEGVCALRRARNQRDHGDHRAEHVGVRRSSGSARDRPRAGAAVLADIGIDAVKVGMLGTRRDGSPVAQALDELPAGTPVVVDPVMVAESGARCSTRTRSGRWSSRSCRGRACSRRTCPRRARCVARAEPRPRASATEATPRRGRGARAGAARARPARGRPHRRSSRARRRPARSTADGADVAQIAGERHPDGAAHGSGCTHSSVLAAQLALGRTPLRPRAPRARWPARPSRTACATSARGPGPSTCSASPGCVRAPSASRCSDTAAPGGAVARLP